ncbi:hypothetical protein R3W88_033719 [Solanum pinnatisectum]|uniref:Uncharacterized protein n=1 Tax=Solanum pinnatisectum TaxID=50273 RepID=A0AAV9K202_9SOLN|nr:hypothetical protein R3W88_033719 [Solanum pinnatisectum]
MEIGKEKYFCTKPVLRAVVDFYTNLIVLEGNIVTSAVNEVELIIDHIRLGEILKIPTNGLAEYVWLDDENCLLTSKFSQGRASTRARKVLKGEMAPFHKLLFEIVHKGILPKRHRGYKACLRDIGIAHALENIEPIDWPSLMIKDMARIVDPQPSSYQLAYGNLFSIVFKEFFVPLGEGECGLLVEPYQTPIVSPRASRPVASLLRDLKTARDQIGALQAENASLRTDLTMSQGEVAKLQEQLVNKQIDNNCLMDRVFSFLLPFRFLLSLVLNTPAH